MVLDRYKAGIGGEGFRNDLMYAMVALDPEASDLHMPLSAEMAEFVALWLDNCHAQMGNSIGIYSVWAETAVDAAAKVGYAGLDEKIWDLEQRLSLVEDDPEGESDEGWFGAFLAGYNGDFAQASLLWEEIGDLTRAIDASMCGG